MFNATTTGPYGNVREDSGMVANYQCAKGCLRGCPHIFEASYGAMTTTNRDLPDLFTPDTDRDAPIYAFSCFDCQTVVGIAAHAHSHSSEHGHTGWNVITLKRQDSESTNTTADGFTCPHGFISIYSCAVCTPVTNSGLTCEDS